MNIPILIVILAVIFSLLFVVGIYNNLVRLKTRVSNAWAQIDTQLKRRFDLIPNLIETVKGYSNYEASTLEKIVEVRNSFNNSATAEDKMNANNLLTNSLKSLFALSEAYPDLKANQSFVSLQTELSGTEDKVAFARQFYNDCVQMYNEAIVVFPNNIIANMFNFKQNDFFMASEEEKENVKVSF